jgi:hypothetical protein
MSGPTGADVSGPQCGDGSASKSTRYVVRSPCCGRRVLVEGWELAYAEWYTNGRVHLRCGSLLNTPGWGKEGKAHGCGQTFDVAADEITERA